MKNNIEVDTELEIALEVEAESKAAPKKDILSLSFEELQDTLTAAGEEKFRAGQIFDWLHVKKVREFSEMTNISEQLRQFLTNYFCIKRLIIRKKLVSEYDYTVKYLYEMEDGETIETVLMRYRHANSLCISTQAGCKMNCAFCASGEHGFIRDLTPSEMLLQLYETERDHADLSPNGYTVGSIVLMGIGEPLDNFDNVIKFLKLLSDKNGRNMSLRHVSLSTCGLADKIDELAQLKLGLTLSVSLHAADDAARNKIMPVNFTYNIERLMDSCKNYYEKTGRRISFEYALIKDLNDDEQSAERLAALVRPMSAHVNLIPVNNVCKHGIFSPAKSPERADIQDFHTLLTRNGVNTTIRRTLGSDISAACGQLRSGS